MTARRARDPYIARLPLVLAALETGMHRSKAASAAGIHHQTLYNWIEAREDVRLQVEQAEATFIAGRLAVITTASEKPQNWTAAAWLLERRFPELYGQRQKVDITIDTREEARRIAEELGMSVDDVLAEAEAVIAAARGDGKA